ncbi:MAG TPA: hypothetical protein VF442_12225 [Sphingobium sp.]
MPPPGAIDRPPPGAMLSQPPGAMELGTQLRHACAEAGEFDEASAAIPARINFDGRNIPLLF